MTHRSHNFSAGPAALPLPVLEEVQRDLLDFDGTGMSIMEMSHRSKAYDRVHSEAIADLRQLLDFGDDYSVLLMQGGARTQFALVAMNLLGTDQHAEYLVTGSWSTHAFKEAQKIGDARETYSSADTGHDRVPKQDEIKVDPKAAYLHYTSNNTIFGTQFGYVPGAGDVPVVCDMSSDILSRKVDVSKLGVIYAGAQKNMGPAGVTVVIIRNDLLERSSSSLPDMFSYSKQASKNSLLNTPPCFAIYVVGRVAKHLLGRGGLAAVAKDNQEQAALVYGAIEASGGFYKAHARSGCRSEMNIAFRLQSPDLEAKFVKESTAEGLNGLKGHRSVGGVRASIYNAAPRESVLALVQFMRSFMESNG